MDSRWVIYLPYKQKPMKNIVNTIEKLRQQSNLSWSDLAERSELSPAFIFKLKEGDFKSLSLMTCKKLADAFDMTLKDFLEELGILDNKAKPSFQMISQALRSNGYTPEQINNVLKYAKYIKKEL